MVRNSKQACGLALIAVLWLVAAMSLIIAGIVQSTKIETGALFTASQTHLAGAKADAAILITLQRAIHDQANLPKGRQTHVVEFAGDTVSVEMTPMNAFVDLNRASIALLADLYQFAGGLQTEAAMNLALETSHSRQINNSKNVRSGFDAPDDLMGVPGMTYMVYAKVAPLITTDIKNGNGRVNPLAAPVELLTVLTQGNLLRAHQFASQRENNNEFFDASFFKPDLIEMTNSKSVRLTAEISLANGTIFRKYWNVYMATNRKTGIPWRVLGKGEYIVSSSTI